MADSNRDNAVNTLLTDSAFSESRDDIRYSEDIDVLESLESLSSDDSKNDSGEMS